MAHVPGTPHILVIEDDVSLLLRHRGQVLSKVQLLQWLWSDAHDPNLVEAQVSALRRMLEAHGPRVIHTVRTMGYRLSP